MSIPDLKGNVYGRLTVIKYAGRSQNRNDMWLCRCECGVLKTIASSHLKRGSTKSCGCFRKDSIAEIATKHGFFGHPIYALWIRIKQRCYNKNHKHFKDYGGRGIAVCKEWAGNPVAFIKWAMENGYTEGLQIDRIDNDGNYTPANCRFTTSKVNNRNRRDNRIIEYRGRKMSLAEFCEVHASHCSYSTVWRRLKLGWSFGKIINTPVRGHA